MAACSSSTADSSSTTPSNEEPSITDAPVPTLRFEQERFEWVTGEPKPDGLKTVYPILVPVAGPGGEVARISVHSDTAGSSIIEEISVRWAGLNNADELLTVTITRGTGIEPFDCKDQTRAGNSPEEVMITVRSGLMGCSFTNEGGLYFLRWVEGGDSFHLSARLTDEEVRHYLEAWEHLS